MTVEVFDPYRASIRQVQAVVGWLVRHGLEPRGVGKQEVHVDRRCRTIAWWAIVRTQDGTGLREEWREQQFEAIYPWPNEVAEVIETR